MSSSLRVGGEKSAPVRRGAGAGMACRQRKSARPTENPQRGFAELRPLQFMADDRRRKNPRQQPSAGSACRQQAGAGSACRQQAGAGTACRKSARPTENPQCGFADFGRFSLWRTIVVERTRGSNRVQAQPAGSKRVQAQPAGSKRVQALPAGSRQGRPKIRSADSQTSAASVYGGRQSSKEPAAATGCRHCLLS